MFLYHGVRTPKRTAILTETLASLGRLVRINQTLWLVATEHSCDAVYARIHEQFKTQSGIEHTGDVLVVEASEFSGSASQEAISQIQTICDIQSTPLPPEPPPASKQVSIPLPRSEGIMGPQSRREQIAEEYGIKTTDAMFRKVSGSFESGKR